MNVAAESLAQSSYYQFEAEQLRSEQPVLRALQQQGLADFRRLGFPGRRDEDWRYTSVTGFLKHEFQHSKSSKAFDETLLISEQSDVPWGQKIAFVDGVLVGLEALRATLPSGVLVMPIVEAIQHCPEKITPYLNQILQSTHGFHAQNTAMLQSGLFVHLPENVVLPEPILIVHRQTSADQAVYLRHVIVAEADAAVTVIEDYQGDVDLRYYTNVVTELYAAPKAQINHYKIQRESQAAYHVGHVAATLTVHSRVESHSLTVGGLWSRSDTSLRFSESYAEGLLNGIYALNDQQHVDHHTWVYHDVEHCTSIQNYKGILNGKSRGVFNGQVHVAPYAQKTVAEQQNKNLLLSKQAEIDTKPQLEIAADDVKCTHGATIGQLDADALFYFASRGIDMAEATRYLIQAFTADNLRAMHHEALADWMNVMLNQHVGS
ncbi:MAG: Fe-S cluster assembly protein SufD [Gammaproteobacteria bacterium]|nr:Fe-S cluster assembly protein SufD [Gammaproteobacteria bacterium]